MSFMFYSKVHFVGSLTSTFVNIYFLLLITLCLVRKIYMVVYKNYVLIPSPPWLNGPWEISKQLEICISLPPKLAQGECHRIPLMLNQHSPRQWLGASTQHAFIQSQCWPRNVLPYSVTKPQWVNRPTFTICLSWKHFLTYQCFMQCPPMYYILCCVYVTSTHWILFLQEYRSQIDSFVAVTGIYGC